MKEFKGFGKPPVKKDSFADKFKKMILANSVTCPFTGRLFSYLPTGHKVEYFLDEQGEVHIEAEEVCKAIGMDVSDFHYWKEHEYEPKHGITDGKTFYVD